MVTIIGKVYEPSGLPTTAPFKVWLVSYGTDPQTHKLYVSPTPQTVTPDPVTGEFSFEVWANVTADVPCYYRVQFDFGLQLKLLVPASETPLEFTDLIVDDTVELIPGIINRVAKLESPGGIVLPTQNFSLGGWATSPLVPFNGTAPVVIPIDSFNSQGLTGVIPKPLLSGSYNISLDNALTFGSGLTGNSGSSYSGDTANTLEVDSTVARRTDPQMTDAREWSEVTVSQVEAETGTGIGRRAWTPERVWQSITGYLAQYLPSATLEEAELGTGTGNRSWSPSRITALVSNYTQSNGVQSVAGKAGDVTLVPSDITGLGDVTNASNLLTGVVNSALVPLAQTATKLATARTINGVSFDGTANIVVPTPSSLTFGTGLVAGNFNGSSDTTLAIDTGVVVQQSDSRLTDAREWSAPTVTQAEAEAGTSTNRRAFTPQRVAQAIVSWINQFGVKSVAGRIGDVALTKSDVGLSNVQNVDQTNASNLLTGTVSASLIPILNQNTTGNAATATVLETSRTIALSGGATGTATGFNGSSNITIPVTSVNATSLTGTIADARLGVNVALRNVTNTFTDSQRIVRTQNPGLFLESLDGGDNLKIWSIRLGSPPNNAFNIQTRNDDGSHIGTWLSISREGNINVPRDIQANRVGVGNFAAGLSSYNSSHPISPLVSGSTSGFLLEGLNSGHIVAYLKCNDIRDSFSIVRSNFTESSLNRVPEKLLFQVRSDGDINCDGNIYANKVSYTQDDEVIFTPTISGTGWVYGTQYGRYVRQGRRVEFLIILSTPTVGTHSGTVAIQGLPVGAINSSFFGGCGVTGLIELQSSYDFCPVIQTDGTIIIQYLSGSPSSFYSITTANFTSSTEIRLAGSYITAS